MRSTRIVFAVLVFLTLLVYFFYQRNEDGWAKVRSDARLAYHQAPGVSWRLVAKDIHEAFKEAPEPSDDSVISDAPDSPALAGAEAAPMTNPAPAESVEPAPPPPVAPAQPSLISRIKGPVPDVPRFPVPVPSPAPTNWATFAPSGISTNAVAGNTVVPSPDTNSGVGSAPPSAAPTGAPFVAAKPWSAPEVMPAQANWTWTTSDGQEYDDVVVNKIEPDMVSITHSRGVAHVAIDTLPPEIQKQLGYDPAAAMAAKKEAKREADHPYYRLAELADAQAAARELHWPLAWMCGNLVTLSETEPVPNSEGDQSIMAINDLKSQAIVIYLNSNGDLIQVPPVVLNQFFQFDDGPVPGGHHFYPPKIVFSDPDGKKALGRVSSTQMKASREGAISAVLERMEGGPAVPATGPSTTVPAAAGP
jgi:hypothetical protein